MAKGKGGSRTKYVSKGERASSMKTSLSNPALKLINQQKALLKGRNVVVKTPVVTTNSNGKDVTMFTKTTIVGKKWLEKRQNIKVSAE